MSLFETLKNAEPPLPARVFSSFYTAHRNFTDMIRPRKYTGDPDRTDTAYAYYICCYQALIRSANPDKDIGKEIAYVASLQKAHLLSDTEAQVILDELASLK